MCGSVQAVPSQLKPAASIRYCMSYVELCLHASESQKRKAMNPDHQVARQPHEVNAKTRITFVAGPKVYDYQLEYSALHRAIRIDGQQVLFFSEVEYQLFMLLVEYHFRQRKQLSYHQIPSTI